MHREEPPGRVVPTHREQTVLAPSTASGVCCLRRPARRARETAYAPTPPGPARGRDQCRVPRRRRGAGLPRHVPGLAWLPRRCSFRLCLGSHVHLWRPELATHRLASPARPQPRRAVPVARSSACSRAAADATTAVRAMPAGVVSFQGRCLNGGDFLATWVVELAVHHIDLAAANSPLPPGLAWTRQTLEALVAAPSRRDSMTWTQSAPGWDERLMATSLLTPTPSRARSSLDRPPRRHSAG